MEKIVITGYGIKAPNGFNNAHFKDSLINKEYNLDYYSSTLGKNVIVGKVPDTELEGFDKTRYSRVAKIALASAKEAIEMANIPKDKSLRVAVVYGSASGPTEEAVITNQSCFNENVRKYPLLGIGLMSYHTISSSVLNEYGLDGKTYTLVTGCTSGADALFMGKLLLDSNQADICVIGGADAPLCEPVFYGFSKLRMLEHDVEMIDAGVPFSNRDRFIISEGAGTLVIEKESVAYSRKARKIAELKNIVSNNDGLSAFKSEDSGKHLMDLVEEVSNGVDITYINSQALGLKQNDNIDLNARDTFLAETPLTSIKGVTGHPFGAMPIIQVVASLISIENNFIPPTKTNEETTKLNIISEKIDTVIDNVLVTSHGFGGNNSCILIGG